MTSIKSADSRTASNAPARLQISSQNVASPPSSTPTTATQRSSFPIKGFTPQMRDNFDFTLGSVWTADDRCGSGSTFVEVNEAGIA